MKINKLLPFVYLIGSLVPSLCLGQKQPNLIVYMIDDLGWNQISAKQVTMGTHTGSFITPHIERIANRGLSFTHAYTQPNSPHPGQPCFPDNTLPVCITEFTSLETSTGTRSRA